MQKFSLPPTMVGALTQSYIKNSGSKIQLHETLMTYSVTGTFTMASCKEMTFSLDAIIMKMVIQIAKNILIFILTWCTITKVI